MERTILNKWYRLCSTYVPLTFKTNILESKEVLKGGSREEDSRVLCSVERPLHLIVQIHVVGKV